MTSENRNSHGGPSILEELRMLYEEATPGPWDAVISTGCVRYLGPPVEPAEHGDYVANCRGLDAASANSYLIAAMHRALPLLLRVVDTARLAINEDGSVFVGKCEAVSDALRALYQEAM